MYDTGQFPVYSKRKPALLITVFYNSYKQCFERLRRNFPCILLLFLPFYDPAVYRKITMYLTLIFNYLMQTPMSVDDIK